MARWGCMHTWIMEVAWHYRYGILAGAATSHVTHSSPHAGWTYTSTKASVQRQVAQARGLQLPVDAVTTAPADSAAADRPSTSRSAGGDLSNPAGGSASGPRPNSAPLPHNRELVSLQRAQQARLERSGGPTPDPLRPPSTAAAKSPNCTTYHTSYNTRDEHPEMYAA